MRRYSLAFALVLLVAPTPALESQTPADPQTQTQQQPGRRGFRNPLEALLENRERLSLTGDQVARLESIQTDLQRRNQPLVQQLEQLRQQRQAGRPTPEEREALRQRRAELAPVMQQLRENTRTAMEQARAVLTSEQQEQLRSIMAERRGPDRNRDGRGGRGWPPRQARPNRPAA